MLVGSVDGLLGIADGLVRIVVARPQTALPAFRSAYGILKHTVGAPEWPVAVFNDEVPRLYERRGDLRRRFEVSNRDARHRASASDVRCTGASIPEMSAASPVTDANVRA